MTPNLSYSILLICFKIMQSDGINVYEKSGYTKPVLTLDDTFCKTNACVRKCCPPNKHVKDFRNCGVNDFSNYNLDFSDMKVYTRDRSEVLSTVNKTLTLIPETNDNMTFLDIPIRLNLLPDINLYVTEDAYLYKEVPNFYDRWSRWNHTEFCIDYYFDNTSQTKPIPQMWISFKSAPDKVEYNMYQKYGDLVSCFFLLLVFTVYIILPNLRNRGGKIVMAYVFCLFWSYVFLHVNQNYVLEHCIPMALVTYFFYMATFCWMNIMSFDIWWTFRDFAKTHVTTRREEHVKFLLYLLYACGLPLAMTIGLGIVDSFNLRQWPWIVTPSIGRGECFLEGGSKFLYLYIPMTILIAMNWLFFLMTAYSVWRLCRGTKMLDLADSRSSQHKQWSRFMVYIKLSVVMGLSWVFELLSYLFPSTIWNITDIYNIFIGLAIFIIFICKKKIYHHLRRRFKKSSSTYDWRRSTQNTELVNLNSIKDSKRDTRQLKTFEFEIKI